MVRGTGRQSPVQGKKALFFPSLGLHAWKTHVAAGLATTLEPKNKGYAPKDERWKETRVPAGNFYTILGVSTCELLLKGETNSIMLKPVFSGLCIW